MGAVETVKRLDLSRELRFNEFLISLNERTS